MISIRERQKMSGRCFMPAFHPEARAQIDIDRRDEKA